jgi:hypothetical protein
VKPAYGVEARAWHPQGPIRPQPHPVPLHFTLPPASARVSTAPLSEAGRSISYAMLVSLYLYSNRQTKCACDQVTLGLYSPVADVTGDRHFLKPYVNQEFTCKEFKGSGWVLSFS